MRTALAAVASMLLTACSVAPHAEVWRAPDFAVRAGQMHRIAVLPFADRTAAHGPLWYLGRPFAWLARVATLDFGRSAPDPAATAAALRSLLVARLQGERVSVVNPSMVDESLAQLPADFDRSDLAALAERLDVDGVVTGALRRMGASYWLFSTHRELVADVALHCGWDGSRVFAADVRVDDTAGIDHGPTGFVSLVAVPLAALESGPYTEMSIAWAEEVGQALVGGSRQQRLEPAPVIQVLAVDAPYRPLRPGDRVQVVVEGSPGVEATFDLGSLHRQIPMFAVDGAPEGSTRYRGFYTVRDGDRVDRAPVIARLERPSGGVASERSQRLIDIPAPPSAAGAGGGAADRP